MKKNANPQLSDKEIELIEQYRKSLHDWLGGYSVKEFTNFLLNSVEDSTITPEINKPEEENTDLKNIGETDPSTHHP